MAVSRQKTGPMLLAGIALAFGLAVSFTGQMPRTENGTKIWMLVLLGFAAGVGMLAWGFKEYKRQSLIANVPTSRIRSLAQGVVELEGTARQPRNQELYAPFSGNECVLYKYKIEEYRQRGKHSHWETIDSGRSDSYFYLDDGTGQVLVDSTGADIRIPADDTYHADSFDELPAPAQRFVANTADTNTQQDEVFEEDRRYKEWYIAPGEHVYVFGEAFPRDDHRGSSVNPDNAVINKDKDTPMFIIADKPEEDLKESLSHHTYLGIIGGFLLAVGGFTFLLLTVGLL